MILLTVLSLFALIGYFIANQVLVREFHNEAEHILFENEDEAIKAADLVVEVRATKESKSIIEEEDGFISGYTLTEVEVINVLTNNSGDIVGDQITVAEPYIVTDRVIGSDIYAYGDYTPLQDQTNYILLLNWGKGINEYWVQSLEQGKVNIDSKDKKEKAAYDKNEQYKELAKKIKDKYNK